MFHKLLYLLIILALLYNFNNAETFPECEGVYDETFVAVASNCSKAIFCNGKNSDIVECDRGTPYFSEEQNSCYKDSNVCGNRPYGSFATTTTVLTSKIPNVTPPSNSNSTTKITPVASTATTTINLTTTTATTTTSTTVPSTTRTTVSSTITKIPIYSTSSSLSDISSSTSFKPPTENLSCPPENDNTKPLFLPMPQSCSQYYLCYFGMATVLQCPNGLYFDVNLQSCNTAQQVQCQWNNALTPRDQCQPHIVDVYPHPVNCNYYYLCEHGYLMVMQCPFNMAWDHKERKCVKKSNANCYNDGEV